jgi:hypothetical protein
MSLLDRFHEQYESGGDLILFRCSKCGYTSLSLGRTHAHIETHRGYTRFNIQIPFTATAFANVDRLMEYTDVLRVTDTEAVALADVDGL